MAERYSSDIHTFILYGTPIRSLVYFLDYYLNVVDVLGHSKYGIYVCKYADVCIRHASVRRTWEGNIKIKLIIFKVSLIIR